MTQSQRILNHLREYGSITQLQAMNLYGVARLGARVFDLKKEGHKITREIATGLNRFGEKTHFAVYRLLDDEPSV